MTNTRYARGFYYANALFCLNRLKPASFSTDLLNSTTFTSTWTTGLVAIVDASRTEPSFASAELPLCPPESLPADGGDGVAGLVEHVEEQVKFGGGLPLVRQSGGDFDGGGSGGNFRGRDGGAPLGDVEIVGDEKPGVAIDARAGVPAAVRL